MKKKILFVITKSNWGGAQKYVYELATSLPPGEYDVAVALGGSGGKDEKAGELARRLESAHIRTIFVHSFLRDIRLMSDLRVFFELAEIFRVEKPDAVHLNSSKAVASGALAAFLEGVPKRIATVHGWAFREDRPLWQRAMIACVQWFSSLFLTHIIVLHGKDKLSWPFMASKTHVIHNASPAVEYLERAIARSELSRHIQSPVRTDAPWIGTVGELTKNKGHVYALRALAKLERPVAYLVIGDGELRDALEREATALGILERVHFLGHVPGAAQYVTAFDAYILPSVKEGWPYTLLEAAVGGVPIVATDVGGVREMLGGSYGVVAARDSAAMAEAITQALGADGAKAAEHVREHVMREFTHERMLASTRALYD